MKSGEKYSKYSERQRYVKEGGEREVGGEGWEEREGSERGRGRGERSWLRGGGERRRGERSWLPTSIREFVVNVDV